MKGLDCPADSWEAGSAGGLAGDCEAPAVRKEPAVMRVGTGDSWSGTPGEGSCWAVAVIANTSTANALREKINVFLEDFS